MPFFSILTFLRFQKHLKKITFSTWFKFIFVSHLHMYFLSLLVFLLRIFYYFNITLCSLTMQMTPFLKKWERWWLGLFISLKYIYHRDISRKFQSKLFTDSYDFKRSLILKVNYLFFLIWVSPHNSATGWVCWVEVSGHTPLSSCPRWMGLKAQGRNKAAGNLH